MSLGGSDLAFDADECERMCASAEAGVVMERTGGWPLAVSLLAGAEPPVTAYRHLTELADVALAELSPAARQLLIVLARVPRVPHRLLMRLGEAHSDLGDFGRRHPELLVRDGDWWAPREWLRNALGEAAASPSLVGAVAAALVGLDEDELAVQLLVAEARYEHAVAPLERLAADGLRQGRPAWVRSLIAMLPPSARTLRLDIFEAMAVQALNVNDGQSASEQALLDLMSRAAADPTASTLQVAALLANHYRMMGDARLLAVCPGAARRRARRRLSGGRARWSLVAGRGAGGRRDAPVRGSGPAVRPDAASVERGRRLVATALGLLDSVGRPTTYPRAPGRPTSRHSCSYALRPTRSRTCGWRPTEWPSSNTPTAPSVSPTWRPSSSSPRCPQRQEPASSGHVTVPSGPATASRWHHSQPSRLPSTSLRRRTPRTTTTASVTSLPSWRPIGSCRSSPRSSPPSSVSC